MNSGCVNGSQIIVQFIIFFFQVKWPEMSFKELRNSSACLSIDLIYHVFLAKLKHSISLKSNIFPWETSAEFFTD